MRYFAFEAGSRAGFSTERFFNAYKESYPNDDVLVMVDSDPHFAQLPSENYISRVSEETAFISVTKGDIVFPCDELTRQRNILFRDICKGTISEVEDWFFDKRRVNMFLSEGANEIKIPKTFQQEDLFIKPNTASAGSKGCYKASNLCISERINISHEYVVDCIEKDDKYKVFPREVVLRNGYDKYVKLLPTNGEFVDKIIFFLQSVKCPIFKGIFHLQLAENNIGEIYYIESSKRISGSSIVNIHRGFNPFCFINGIDAKDENLDLEGIWYRYDDLL